jgi:hypothetical protein
MDLSDCIPSSVRKPKYFTTYTREFSLTVVQFNLKNWMLISSNFGAKVPMLVRCLMHSIAACSASHSCTSDAPRRAESRNISETYSVHAGDANNANNSAYLKERYSMFAEPQRLSLFLGFDGKCESFARLRHFEYIWCIFRGTTPRILFSPAYRHLHSDTDI